MADTERFDRAASAARTSFQSRDWNDTIQWQDAAWHAWTESLGPAVRSGDVPDLQAARLVDEVGTVLALGARARLAMAGPAADDLQDAIDHLRAAIADFPSREDLRRLLMVALTRAGRAPEALEAFNEAAQHALDTTGLEPSQALRSLRDTIASGDPLPVEEEEQPFLVLTPPGGDQQVVTVPLDRPLSLGRSPDNDVPIDWDGEVSRRHLELRPDNLRHVLADLGSSNGTVLNGRQLVDPLHLVDGDVIRVGTTLLVYRNPAGAPASDLPLASGTMLRVMPTPSSVVNAARQPEGEGPDELDVTILFCDLRGWTTASGQVTPQRARELLNVFYDLAAEVVLRHGGTVLQMAGDEVYACFGAPVPQDDHARRGLAAALDLVAREGSLAADLRARDLPTVRFGVGLNSGPVAPFAIGAADRRQLGLVGTTVNVAARLCSEAGPGEVVFAASVRDRGAGLDVGVGIGALDLKNVDEPVVAYRATSDQESSP